MPVALTPVDLELGETFLQFLSYRQVSIPRLNK